MTTLIWAVLALCMLMRLHALKYLRLSTINKIMFIGEVMPIRHFNKWLSYYPKASFVKLYGPTEIICYCTFCEVDMFSQFQSKRISIGILFDNERVFLLDENIHLVKGDGTGEVCEAGTALAQGYYRNL